jgi:hypothetical protein
MTKRLQKYFLGMHYRVLEGGKRRNNSRYTTALIIFAGAVNRNSIFSELFYYYFIPTTCFAPRAIFRWNIYLSILRGYLPG